MIALLLAALFAALAIASALTLADAVVRGWNAFRLLRGDLARIDALRNVTVRIEGDYSPARMPALRPAAVSAARLSRRTVRAPERLRAAA